MWASPEVLTFILDLIGSLWHLVEPQKVTPTLNGKHSVAYIKPSPNSTRHLHLSHQNFSTRIERAPAHSLCLNKFC